MAFAQKKSTTNLNRSQRIKPRAHPENPDSDKKVQRINEINEWSLGFKFVYFVNSLYSIDGVVLYTKPKNCNLLILQKKNVLDLHKNDFGLYYNQYLRQLSY